MKTKNLFLNLFLILLIINLSSVLLNATLLDLDSDGFLEISTCAELNEVRNDLISSYELLNNIDCSETSTWNSGAGWQPIGNSMMPFTGNFNGQGYSITGLTINLPYSDEVGLFGQIGTMASINNLQITSATITGKSRVGILAGNNFGSINKVYTSGSVTGIDLYIGGLIGYNYGAVDKSYSSASVTSTSDEVGGLIGWTEGMISISNSYATGDVTGYRKVGGLVGETSAETYISNCYATGSVSATEMMAGGLVGLNYGSISKSFSTGSVSANSYEGGLVGFGTDMSTITSSYWYNNQQDCYVDYLGIPGNEGCTKATSENDFYTITNPPINTWDFTNTWCDKLDGITYPVFVWDSACSSDNPHWQDMEGNIISTADLKDTVKLVLNIPGENFQGQEIEYEIWKQDGGFWFFDNKVSQGIETGFTTWIAGKNSDTGTFETGNYYFKARAKGTQDWYTSPDLTVLISETNTIPSANLIQPIENLNFIISSSTGKTIEIPFTQNSQDPDDDLRVTWDFGDSTQQEFSNCLTSGTCNTEHQYSNSGTKIINIKAEEMLRTQSAIARSRVFVYKEGLNIFAIIDSPDYKQTFFNIGVYDIDGTSSHVTNCFSLEQDCLDSPDRGTKPCSEIQDISSSTSLFCYLFADSNDLVFRWTIDNKVLPQTTNTPIDYIFVEAGRHDIDLSVSYTY